MSHGDPPQRASWMAVFLFSNLHTTYMHSYTDKKTMRRPVERNTTRWLSSVSLSTPYTQRLHSRARSISTPGPAHLAASSLSWWVHLVYTSRGRPLMRRRRSVTDKKNSCRQRYKESCHPLEVPGCHQKSHGRHRMSPEVTWTSQGVTRSHMNVTGCHQKSNERHRVSPEVTMMSQGVTRSHMNVTGCHQKSQ